jgi:hypothetical protein
VNENASESLSFESHGEGTRRLRGETPARMYERRLKDYAAIGYVTRFHVNPWQRRNRSVRPSLHRFDCNLPVILPCIVFCMCANMHIYNGSKGNLRTGQALVSRSRPGSLARGHWIFVLAEESLHPKELPALRVRQRALELCLVRSNGASPVFHICTGRSGWRFGTGHPQRPRPSETHD